MKYRTEFDSIGKIKVPGDKYWGASTQRSNKYFDIGDFLVRPILIQSIAIVKKAAAFFAHTSYCVYLCHSLIILLFFQNINKYSLDLFF